MSYDPYEHDEQFNRFRYDEFGDVIVPDDEWDRYDEEAAYAELTYADELASDYDGY